MSQLKTMWMDDKVVIELQDPPSATRSVALFASEYLSTSTPDAVAAVQDQPLSALRNLDGLRASLVTSLLHPLFPPSHATAPADSSSASLPRPSPVAPSAPMVSPAIFFTLFLPFNS